MKTITHQPSTVKHIENMLNGVASMFSVFEPRQYRRPARGDFARDNAHLRGDSNRVLSGLRRQIDKQPAASHERKQVNHR